MNQVQKTDTLKSFKIQLGLHLIRGDIVFSVVFQLTRRQELMGAEKDMSWF